MIVLLTAWTLAVASAYAVLSLSAPNIANALTLFFAFAVLVPTIRHDFRRRS